ncbi:hypothetical protein LOTGIDRAFT_116635 [Lottia gigantea]|uniref:PDZ domain-containing protein n=1 Tax=Lottia gigantea TaxID=225164 RepID=V4AFU8_LOTGI|nr:hypothetical protein LOTGIDRAFT_116635 [Lottia gigantea]ESO95777.1 hypothetical protein LOTGIDRAFT_116635 [Lottia gigantea]
MAAPEIAECQLRRKDTSQPWGFRMQGGAEFNMPLYMAQVSSKGIGGKAGLKAGDAILAICKTPVQGWTHERMKAEMIRAGNEMDLTVQSRVVLYSRNVVNTQAAQAHIQQTHPEPRSEVDDGSINPHMNEGSSFRNVKPKTYQILEREAPGAGTRGAGPASIFAKKKNDRSQYLQAGGPTIQKAFGQQ